ncbi:MAG: hypothetical protein P1P88_05825 [Bacteroidales bacterium]|nr:hypothetical protein [Bacteroidales bacterium]
MKVHEPDIAVLIEVIQQNSDYDFQQYSEKSFQRRIEKVLDDHKLSIHQLIEKITANNDFMERLVKDITVNTTEIFRDTKTWHILKYKILKNFIEKEKINIWHIGCSTGQEVYSTLILLNEMGLFSKTEVFATDLNQDVLEVAEKGLYKFREIDEFIDSYDLVMKHSEEENIDYAGIPYQKYFVINRRKNLIKIKPPLLNKPTFLKHDIVKQGNIFERKFDLIFCRNVLIYFNHDLQNKLFEFFYDNLNDDGVLIIGRHEGMLGEIASKFKKEESIYKKRVL